MQSSVQSPPVSPILMVNAAMRFCVVSEDQDLITLCREVLRELGETLSHRRHIECHAGAVPNCELCLWDYEPGRQEPFPDSPDSPRMFYVVRPGHLEALR